MLTQHTHRALPLFASRFPFEPIWERCKQATKIVRDRWGAHRAARITSALPAHLRHDIGELDCRPPAAPALDRALRDGSPTLETTWLRFGL